MSKKNALALGGIFFFFFLLLTPLGSFNDWVPPGIQTGFYSLATIDAGDDTGYYAYLRSFFFDGDFDFADERNYAHAEHFITATGYVFNNWQIGQALLFLPFFLVGHLLALLTGSLGYPVAADGYSDPYYIATAVASGTWLLIGLVFVFHALRKFVAEQVALVAALGIWLASPLLYFSFIRQRMAHTVEFALAAAFLLAWLHWRKSTEWLRHALLGGLLGLLCMVRILNVTFFALVAVDLLLRAASQSRESAAHPVKRAFKEMTAFAGGFVLVMLPQFYSWNQLNGFPLPPRHLHYAGEAFSQFALLPFLKNIVALFMDPQWGLLFSMPLVVAGLAGLFIKSEFLKEIRWPLVATVMGLMAVITLYPEDSASYGHRHLISALPVMALGLAALLHFGLRSRWLWRAAVMAVVLCVSAQYLMIVQYKVTLPYNHDRFTLTALASAPALIFERPDLLLRSSNFLRLIFLHPSGGWNFLDGLFLGVFPLLQLLGVGIVCRLAFLRDRISAAPWLQPKTLAPAGLAGSLILVALVAVAAPTKSEQEIQARLQYKKLLTEADSHLQSQSIEPARSAFERASQLLPDLWNPYFQIGMTWNMQGNLAEANRYYERGLSLNPDNSQVLLNLGDNLRRLGKPRQAETKLQAAIRAWPKNKRAYDALAQLYMGMNRSGEAERMLLAAVRIDPYYGVGHANLAVLYTALHNPSQAVAHLDQAIRLGVRGPVIDKLSAQYR